MSPLRVLHLAPHPDDETIACPATLIALADHGHDVVTYAVSLGRPADHARRRGELTEACRRAGLRLIVPREPLAISSTDDLHSAQELLQGRLDALLHDGSYDLLVGPSPHDRHHGHELVGRAMLHCASRHGLPVWTWGLWADLPLPTVLHGFDEALLERCLRALDAHAGENARNDYRRAVDGLARANSVLGPERVFGFGSPGIAAPCAEVLCELHPVPGGRWALGTAQRFDAAAPVGAQTATDMTWWTHGRSVTERLRAAREAKPPRPGA